jgi:hypothetical protein
MNQAQSELYRSLKSTDSLEEVAGGQLSESKGVGAALRQIVGNPAFKAEIGINVLVKYYSQATVGTPVEVAAASIPVAQKTQLPVFLFGQSDFMGNFAKSRQLYTSTSWNMADMAISCGGATNKCVDYKPLGHAAGAVDHASGLWYNNLINPGDLIFLIPMVGWVAAAAGTTVTAEVRVRCNNVAYITLLDSLSSDLITLNMIRYTVDTSYTSQLNNQLTLIMQSLFGKTATDTIDPTAFVTGGTYNKNIADIPVDLPIDKNLVIATWYNYDTPLLNFTLTAKKIDKLTQVPAR